MSREINLFICPVCGKNTDTFRHPFAKVWCPSCGHVLREEGDKSIQHSGLEKIEPLNPRNVSSEYWNATHENRAKLNEVIEKLNLVMDYLNKGVK